VYNICQSFVTVNDYQRVVVKSVRWVDGGESCSTADRLNLRSPLKQIQQEVTTFLYCAVSDTTMTVELMEKARSEYRGALMWMRDISEHLNPDAERRLNKFRLVT